MDICTQNVKNTKVVWEHLNQLIGRKAKENNLPSTLNSNEINKFFTNLGSSTVENLAPPKYHYRLHLKHQLNSFSISEVTMQELSNCLNSFPSKTSSGFDGMSMKLLKLAFPYLANCLLSLINKSFKNGCFPDKLKIAKVIPIFKGGSPDNLINFRPISILPAISKLFERLMYNRMLSFINKYELLSSSQFGFRKNCNTELAMLRTLDFITSSLNAGTPSIGLFVDISKAFDSINHAILLDKLLCLGFRGVVYSWLSSYLSQRFQYVEVNGVKSSLSKM